MKQSFLCLVVVWLTACSPKVPLPDGPAKPTNGVFMLANMFSSTVLEIKDGHFRYWFDSDVRLPKEPEYPLSGEYLVNGDTITLKHDQIYERRWTFRILNGKVTLWRPSAIDYYNEKQLFDPYGILRLTDKQADEAWRTRHGTPHGQTK